MDPTLVAMVSIGLAATSEIIGMSSLRHNSIVQLVLDILGRIFTTKKP